MTTIAQTQNRVRNTIAGIFLAGVVAITMTFASALPASAAVRYGDPDNRRPLSITCILTGFKVCKWDTICWYGNKNVASTSPKAGKRSCITYRY